ncbi:hypothetical protein A9Q84_18975 [Halobacteriovorax marinus]|uniref:N-acetyltransferase domain-containing protein n=1 Tax=Halobacteriovorax marinus TaxID=97084 RepID=A0A1Y5F2U5_9BACT|nr:hypothetical protein A9Q84_18975 [Halobacteriovorax marinus]
MSSAIVRRAQFGDEEGIHTAHMKSIVEICARDYSSEQIDAWGRREYNYEAKRQLIAEQNVWVVERDNIIEGYGLLFISKEKKSAEIGALYLTPCVLGLGLGKEIITQMKQVSKELGFKEIYLDSTKTSKKFYESIGAIQYKENIQVQIGGLPFECHPMRIEL